MHYKSAIAALEILPTGYVFCQNYHVSGLAVHVIRQNDYVTKKTDMVILRNDCETLKNNHVSRQNVFATGQHGIAFYSTGRLSNPTGPFLAVLEKYTINRLFVIPFTVLF